MTARLGPPDWAAVYRLVGGDRTVPARPVERSLAIEQLTSLGQSARQIADRLGITPRSVHRHRARRRAT